MATLLFTLLPFAVTFTAAAFSPAEPDSSRTALRRAVPRPASPANRAFA